MSKIGILLCAVFVASLNATVNDQFEVENEIQSIIDDGLSALKKKYSSTRQTASQNAEKLNEKYNSIITDLTVNILEVEQKAWDEVNDIRVSAPLMCDIEENLGGRYDCSKAIKEVVDKGVELVYSANRCAVEAWINIYNNKNLSEAETHYERASSWLIALKQKPLCSSQYDETTQLELVASCNEMFREEVNEVINDKQLPVLAMLEDTENFLHSLLSDAPECGNDLNITAHQAEVDEATGKAKTCYEQCRLENELQNLHGNEYRRVVYDS